VLGAILPFRRTLLLEAVPQGHMRIKVRAASLSVCLDNSSFQEGCRCAGGGRAPAHAGKGGGLMPFKGPCGSSADNAAVLSWCQNQLLLSFHLTGLIG
jgi:hypothetical protein